MGGQRDRGQKPGTGDSPTLRRRLGERVGIWRHRPSAVAEAGMGGPGNRGRRRPRLGVSQRREPVGGHRRPRPQLQGNSRPLRQFHGFGRTEGDAGDSRSWPSAAHTPRGVSHPPGEGPLGRRRCGHGGRLHLRGDLQGGARREAGSGLGAGAAGGPGAGSLRLRSPGR